MLRGFPALGGRSLQAGKRRSYDSRGIYVHICPAYSIVVTEMFLQKSEGYEIGLRPQCHLYTEAFDFEDNGSVPPGSSDIFTNLLLYFLYRMHPEGSMAIFYQAIGGRIVLETVDLIYVWGAQRCFGFVQRHDWLVKPHRYCDGGLKAASPLIGSIGIHVSNPKPDPSTCFANNGVGGTQLICIISVQVLCTAYALAPLAQGLQWRNRQRRCPTTK